MRNPSTSPLIFCRWLDVRSYVSSENHERNENHCKSSSVPLSRASLLQRKYGATFTTARCHGQQLERLDGWVVTRRPGRVWLSPGDSTVAVFPWPCKIFISAYGESVSVPRTRFYRLGDDEVASRTAIQRIYTRDLYGAFTLTEYF